MRILLTGANGFIGKNLFSQLQFRKEFEITIFDRNKHTNNLNSLVKNTDWIIHLAGVNRSNNFHDFLSGNKFFAENLCKAIKESGKRIPIIFSSSIQAEKNNPYGKSKLAAEKAFLRLQKESKNPVFIYRLPNVFGKWALPNYNSVVATFCYNISRNLPIVVHDPQAQLKLVYIDDVIDSFISLIKDAKRIRSYVKINTEYQLTVNELLENIKDFKKSRDNLISKPVGSGLLRALYVTYISYLKPENFTYELKRNEDKRGIFVEMLKTTDSGQISYFTANPGETRGDHYHHSKTEKFLVISGKAKFVFKHILTGKSYKLIVSDKKSEVVETVPGWAHNITNIGKIKLICLLWSNEIFNKNKPDTFTYKIEPDS